MIKHQYRLRRGYQFPNTVHTIPDEPNYGYVVNVTGNKPLYGVVKYIVNGDTIAWVESPNHFGQDVEQATKWVRETLQKVTHPIDYSTCDECHQIVTAVYDLTPYNWPEGSDIAVCNDCYDKVAHELKEDGAILDKPDPELDF